MAEMTREVLVAACKGNGGYAAPRLNDQLFLQCRGFLRIENLDDYVNLKVLWLEQNAISELTGLEALQQLVSLFVQNNTITSISSLAVLGNLRVINLSHNYLTSLEGIANACPLLETLQVSHNHIGSLDACSDLWGISETLTSVDLSFNKIEIDEDHVGPVEFFTRLPKVSVIYFHGNPAIRGIKGYRRNMILQLPQLTYLDERPVFTEERRVVEAWGEGGEKAEAQEREAIRREKKEHLESCVKVLTDRMDENREVRDRLTKEWELRRAAEMERLRELRREWRVQQEELISTEERMRDVVCASESTAWCEIEGVFHVAHEHELVVAAAQREIEIENMNEIEESENENEENKENGGSTMCGPLLSDEDVLREMEEEIRRVLDPFSEDPRFNQTALKMERAVAAVASRLREEKESSMKSREIMWEKFAQWDCRAKQ
ncbi:Leucine-rich repeat-containing protein ODA7 [Trypanosoma theileri]|uniref:Leucine-rich repeat-containing protein ODA7 n=1 Tax=Trypanosoma theileri TaxID=67003 RepID=A0A1X0NUQ9_9TRYP|nr:Leucine-rich repeat-containing protein ODA7 [Trypanosoma theileri]ORC88425.1 Leucine-rich repeat-containing protein ODA7 [Trypanosoma theileri]